LGLPLGEILYVELTQEESGVRGSRVQSVGKISGGVGIEVDAASKTLWASSFANGVYQYTYRFQPREGDPYHDILFPVALIPMEFLRTPFRPDNIVFSPTTRKVTVSGIVSLKKFLTSMGSAEAKKPASWTLELLPKLSKERLGSEEKSWGISQRMSDTANVALRKEEMRWRTVFQDDGGLYGGVSTGAVVQFSDGEGYVGVSLLDRGVVVCTEKGGGSAVVDEERKEGKSGHEEL